MTASSGGGGAIGGSIDDKIEDVVSPATGTGCGGVELLDVELGRLMGNITPTSGAAGPGDAGGPG